GPGHLADNIRLRGPWGGYPVAIFLSTPRCYSCASSDLPVEGKRRVQEGVKHSFPSYRPLRNAQPIASLTGSCCFVAKQVFDPTRGLLSEWLRLLATS